MDLAQQVNTMLEKVSIAQGDGQSKSIEHALKVFDSLRDQGLVEPPTYRLAPLNSVPPKESLLVAKTFSR